MTRGITPRQITCQLKLEKRENRDAQEATKSKNLTKTEFLVSKDPHGLPSRLNRPISKPQPGMLSMSTGLPIETFAAEKA